MHTYPRAFSAALVFAIVGAVVPVFAQLIPGTVPDTFTGPSSSQTPYVNPSVAGWEVVSLVTVGDAADNGYRMVGIPDGLSAVAGRYSRSTGRYADTRTHMTVFMNHELTATAGIPRGHGQPGAFVSQWEIDLRNLKVIRGQDLIDDVYTWDTATRQFVFTPTALFSRFCSADLPARTAFYNPATGRGFDGLIHMNGEEAGLEGRAFGHVASGPLKGTSFELPHLGRFSWENAVAHRNTGDRTVVVGLDDSTPGQLYVYRGNKQRSGTPVQKAGLVGGKLYGIRVLNGGVNYGNGPVKRENNGAINGTFYLQDLSDWTVGSGAALQTLSESRKVTEFGRPEDGVWDTQNPNVFYFVTTGAVIDGRTQSSKLYKLTFNDVKNALLSGGRIEMVIDRSSLPPVNSPLIPQFDNLTVTGNGRLVIQEDSGNNPYLSRVWYVHPRTKTATQILISDPARFEAPTRPFTQDEESSGVIEITRIIRATSRYEPGRRYFLADMQASYPIPGEFVQGGQLYLFASPAPAP